MSSNCYYCGGHPDEVIDLRRRRDELEAVIARQEAAIRACNQKIGELELWNKDYREQIAFWKSKASGA